MKLAIALLTSLFAFHAPLIAQGFVYPVGNSTVRPIHTYPNPNGYIITGDFADESGHTGVDLANGAEGGEIRSIGHGIVSLRESTSESAGFGNVVIICHDLTDGTYYSLYAHMQDGSVLVNVGDVVEAGTPIGKIDCSGSTRGVIPCGNGHYGPHLHFAVKKVNTLGCGYITARCKSGDTFDNYVDPLDFVQSHAAPPSLVKDIWTTSVYSYAPCSGPGPGGGLYDSELRVGGWGDVYLSLIQLDLTGLPPHANSAVLYLYCYSFNSGSGTPMFLDRITQFWWDWQTTGHGCDFQRLWWVDKPSVQSGTTVFPAPTIGQWYAIDITDLYNGWQSNQYPNYGLQLRPTQNSDNFNFFYSSRYTGDSTLRPKLVISSGTVIPF